MSGSVYNKKKNIKTENIPEMQRILHFLLSDFKIHSLVCCSERAPVPHLWRESLKKHGAWVEACSFTHYGISSKIFIGSYLTAMKAF